MSVVQALLGDPRVNPGEMTEVKCTVGGRVVRDAECTLYSPYCRTADRHLWTARKRITMRTS